MIEAVIFAVFMFVTLAILDRYLSQMSIKDFFRTAPKPPECPVRQGTRDEAFKAMTSDELVRQVRLGVLEVCARLERAEKAKS